MKFEFDAEIMRLEGKIKWCVVYFPYSVKEHFGTGGNVPVCVTVDGHAFDHTLLSSKNGHYLVYNEFIKREVKKEIGDTVHVTLERDTKKRELVIPKYIKAELDDASVFEVFMRQPEYLKREQLNHIEVAKKDETKLARLEKLTARLCEDK